MKIENSIIMAQKTKDQLKSTLVNGYLMQGSDFTDLVDSLKGMQSPVSDPSASGNSVTFIATITQDAEGKITVTKKNVNFTGYQTVAGMAGYQGMDLQQVGDVTAAASGSQTINHNMKHYPTVRLLDVATGLEVLPSGYQVRHDDLNNVGIILGASLTSSYKYILD